MANEKNFNTRIVLKHDTEENWLKATGFTPKAGELVIYDIDALHYYQRIKVGDGVNNVNDLPFITDGISDEIKNISTVIAIDDGEGNIELKPFLSEYSLTSQILEGEY